MNDEDYMHANQELLAQVREFVRRDTTYSLSELTANGMSVRGTSSAGYGHTHYSNNTGPTVEIIREFKEYEEELEEEDETVFTFDPEELYD